MEGTPLRRPAKGVQAARSQVGVGDELDSDDDLFGNLFDDLAVCSPADSPFSRTEDQNPAVQHPRRESDAATRRLDFGGGQSKTAGLNPDQLGTYAAWLCEHASPQMAKFTTFQLEAFVNFQRGYAPIPAHCMTRPFLASGNDATTLAKMHSRAEVLATRFEELGGLRKSILTAKTCFVAQEAAFRAALRTTAYDVEEEVEDSAQPLALHLWLMHRSHTCNMIGEHKSNTKPGVRTGSALHFEGLFEMARGKYNIATMPSSYENGEYAAMAICTALGDDGQRRIVPIRMLPKQTVKETYLKDAGLPYRSAASSHPRSQRATFATPWSLKMGQDVFLVKCIEKEVHVGSFLFGVISHPGHNEGAPSEAQIALRSQLIHNLLVGHVTQSDPVYLHKEDIEMVFHEYGRTVGVDWICCDQCETWYVCQRQGITTEQAAALDVWHCTSCVSKYIHD